VVDRAAQTAWVVAVLLGAVAGVWGLVMPVTGMVLAVAATLLALLLRGPRWFGLGGVWLGFGGSWSFFLIRASIECAMNPASSDGCGSRIFQTYLVVGILMAVVGMLVTRRAFRGGRTA
jgi:hypothetical protein